MQLSQAPAATERTIRQVREEIIVKLREAGIEFVELEASWLLEKALHRTSLELLVDLDRKLSPREGAEVSALVDRRAVREPLQYILGTQEFCGLDFEVDPRVLIPRPETQLLVHEVVQAVTGEAPVTIADIGAGSGCVAVSLGKAILHATIYAVDLSESSLEVARRNVRRHALDDRITCVQGDVTAPLERLGLRNKLDVIVSNPPYITDQEWPTLQPEVRIFEPELALRGGREGTDVQKRLLEEAWSYLIPGGLLLMEMGWRQAAKVCELAIATGRYHMPTLCFDAAGIARVLKIRSLDKT